MRWMLSVPIATMVVGGGSASPSLTSPPCIASMSARDRRTSGGASRPLRAAILLVAHDADLLTVERILCDLWIYSKQLQLVVSDIRASDPLPEASPSLINGRCLHSPAAFPCDAGGRAFKSMQGMRLRRGHCWLC